MADKTDIRAGLEILMDEIQKKIGTLREQRDEIDKNLQDAEFALSALRTAYEIQARRLGETRAPLFPKEGVSYRFAGMKVGEALTLLREEKPGITKKQALEILTKEGFDFRGKRPGSSVHFAWIALERKGKKRK